MKFDILIIAKQKHAFHISSSVYCPTGSTLLLTVPSNRTGSWGIIPKRERRSWSPRVQMSMPSMIICPPVGSTSLKKTWMRVDLPLPVRPTTPIFSPPWMLRVIPLSTKGVFGRYLTCLQIAGDYYCTIQKRLKTAIADKSEDQQTRLTISVMTNPFERYS